MIMDVIQRNFFRLLRSGTFGDNEAIEPMSASKWNRLYNISLMHGVAALVYDGIVNRKNDFFLQIPPQQTAKWNKTVEDIEQSNRLINTHISELFYILNKEQLRPILLKGQSFASLYDNGLHRTSGDVDIYFPYSPQAKKADLWAKEQGSDIDGSEKYILKYNWQNVQVEHHRYVQRLTNKLLNRKMQGIIDSEIRCCDSVYVIINGTKIEVIPPTLNLLLIIVRIARYILSEGISLKQIIDLGTFLRKEGDKVDFVKLQKWIDQLRLQHMAQLEGSLLVHLFRFSEDEIPFMSSTMNEDISKIMDEIFLLSANHSEDWYFTQGRNIFVRTSNSSAMMWHLRHSAKFFRYYPSEIVTNFFASFAHSLSHIEE